MNSFSSPRVTFANNFSYMTASRAGASLLVSVPLLPQAVEHTIYQISFRSTYGASPERRIAEICDDSQEIEAQEDNIEACQV